MGRPLGCGQGKRGGQAWGAWPDGDFREMLKEAQSEADCVSQVVRAVFALLSSLGFILEARGSQDKF